MGTVPKKQTSSEIFNLTHNAFSSSKSVPPPYIWSRGFILSFECTIANALISNWISYIGSKYFTIPTIGLELGFDSMGINFRVSTPNGVTVTSIFLLRIFLTYSNKGNHIHHFQKLKLQEVLIWLV